ncbi:MAG: MFS transporter [Puniceicoccales bacterium]|jgi:phosphoglycerate transporter family protein|nr:MFS transporter [Puniceicoccales bacterium]
MGQRRQGQPVPADGPENSNGAERWRQGRDRQFSPQVVARYGYWRRRLLFVLILGYAAFYLVRQNMQVAVPFMLQEFGCSKTQIGWVFSAFPIVYGFGKFASGALCDRVNVRYYMASGLALAALASAMIGLSPFLSVLCGAVFSPLLLIAIFYSFNGLFQSAGWPPIARLMTNWFSPRQLGTYWGVVNASHQVGSVAILLGGAWLGQHWGWRSIFFVPAAICLLISLILGRLLCDTPESEGLPPLEVYEGLRRPSQSSDGSAAGHATFREIFCRYILPNRPLWVLCGANFFLYVVRMGFFNWAPTYLQEARGSSAMGSSVQTSLFELAGLVAGILAGYISDRWAGGKRNAVCAVFVSLLLLCLFGFWKVPAGHPLLDTLLLTVIGFFVYGPQMLAGVAGAELGSGRAAATANGLTGLFGYLGAIFSGFGVGLITDHMGWERAILFYIFCAFASMVLFAMNWPQTAQKK